MGLEVKEMNGPGYFKGKEVVDVIQYSDMHSVRFNTPYAFYVICKDGSKYEVSSDEAKKQADFLSRKEEKNSSMKINVLGTEYDVEMLEERDETMGTVNCDGYTDFSSKEIKVLKAEEKPGNQKDIFKYQNTVLRHEIIHAFLYECGIDHGMQFHNEECVDFFAIQFDKLAKIFEDAGCKG